MSGRARASDPEREAHQIDVHVGRQIRQRRILIGKSQEQLGERLGLTFQQIQKYENGANRVSAGRLLQIADFCGVRVESFFEGLAVETRICTDEDECRQRIIAFAASREGARLILAYLDTPNKRHRKIAMDLLALADASDDKH